MSQTEGGLDRTLGLRGAVTLNLLDMIGVGPFVTLPLLIGAMGGPQAMLGWILGALLAVCDGLVWAELGAAMPQAGGTYAYLQGIFPGRLGRWLSFLFVFQLCFSAPLSVASGCIGLAQYAGGLWPRLATPMAIHAVRVGPYRVGFGVGWPTAVGIGAIGLALLLLYRRLVHVERLGRALLLIVLLAIGWTILTAVWRGHWTGVVAFTPGAFQPSRAFFGGLGTAMLVATYDFWGYYNVTFLGGEVRDPARTIPRALLLSIAIVTVLYLLLNASVLALAGAPAMIRMAADGAQPALLTAVMQPAYAPILGPQGGLWLGRLAALLVMVTAFASVFSLLLGYSRIPFAAARDGNFPRAFGRVHPRLGIPHVSLLVLAGVACVFCCFSLKDVISALVVLRVVLQFGLQQVGVMVLRWRKPHLPRPFRLWLYPLPPLLALAGFSFLVLSRPGFSRELVLSGIVAVLGSAAFVWWEQNPSNPHGGAFCNRDLGRASNTCSPDLGCGKTARSKERRRKPEKGQRMIVRTEKKIASSEITPQDTYNSFRANRRALLKGLGAVGAAAVAGAAFPGVAEALTRLNTVGSPYKVTDRDVTPQAKAQSYNNYYEFGTDKGDPAQNAKGLRTRPWTVKVDGLCKKPQTVDIDKMMAYRPLEQRVYRFRCVEAWSMVIPWDGYSLSEFLKAMDPLPSAKYVEFTSIADKSMGISGSAIPLPYTEGLRMDEAMHPLTLLTFGAYGETLANQQGAPVRVIVPWKYGFKSPKSIVGIRFTDKQPQITWNLLDPQEYGFYSNVNPNYDNARWSQAHERLLNSNSFFPKMVPTLPFNGYGDQVAGLYAGMDLKKFY